MTFWDWLAETDWSGMREGGLVLLGGLLTLAANFALERVKRGQHSRERREEAYEAARAALAVDWANFRSGDGESITANEFAWLEARMRMRLAADSRTDDVSTVLDKITGYHDEPPIERLARLSALTRVVYTVLPDWVEHPHRAKSLAKKLRAKYDEYVQEYRAKGTDLEFRGREGEAPEASPSRT